MTKIKTGSQWTRIATRRVWEVIGENANGSYDMRLLCASEYSVRERESHEESTIRNCFQEVMPENPRAKVRYGN